MNVEDIQKMDEQQLKFHICLQQIEMKEANERHWRTQREYNEKFDLKYGKLDDRIQELEKIFNQEKIAVLTALTNLEKFTLERSHKNELKIYSLSALFGSIMGFVTSFFKFKSG